MRYVHMTSLGCPKNLVDTELVAGGMLSAGVGFASDPELADVRFINTCAFIKPARDEAEDVITEAVEWKKGKRGRKIIVGGCLTQWDKSGVFRKRFPKVDIWLSADENPNLHRHVKSLFGGKRGCADLPPPTPKWLQGDDTPRLQLTPPHYAYLKIADGCDNHCSYCSIPSIRGALRNRPLDSVVKEAAQLVANGVGELIIAAQDTTAYVCPETAANLAELLKALDSLDGEFGIRLLYAHPAGIDDDLIELFRSPDHLLPYIDIPIQHIADPILKAMNRKVSSERIRANIAALRDANSAMTIRTTLILGFPGETEKDFRELRGFVEETRFDRLGVFVYCEEPDTPAANLAEAVSAEIAEARRDEIMTLQSKISLENNEMLIGKRVRAVVDYVDEDIAVARSYMDAPDIDQIVLFENTPGAQPGGAVEVRITEAEEYQLTGTAESAVASPSPNPFL